jgi:hypothetical protein
VQAGRYRIAGGSWGQQYVRQIYTSSFSATLQSGQGLQGKTRILEATYGVEGNYVFRGRQTGKNYNQIKIIMLQNGM